MSRIAKKPVEIPAKVEVSIDGQRVVVKGPKGTLEKTLHDSVSVVKDGQTVRIESAKEGNEFKRFLGLSRTLVANMVEGVDKGFQKSLSLVGVGYRAATQGSGLNLTLGFSHPVEFPAPEGVEFKVEKQTTILVSGASKEVVGEVAAKIRGLRPPEPYHGKGVRYSDEVIQTKVGKAAGKAK